MKIIRAGHLGMCFGVRDAIALAVHQAAAGPLTMLGELVHNETVLSRLRARGITIENNPDAVATPSVMITAHGASERMLAQVRARGLSVLEATCPLVRVAHGAVAELVRDGFHPVVIGRRDHVEVRGLMGDLESFDVIFHETDVLALEERPRFGVAAQTTQPVERVDQLLKLLRWRFPASEVRFIDTVCRPTKENQRAAAEMAAQSDVVVVIGGAHSNNTQELVKTCRRYCPHVHPIQNAADVRAEWFNNAETIGLTAGTSTPDDVIDQVERQIHQMAAPGAPVSDPAWFGDINHRAGSETGAPIARSL